MSKNKTLKTPKQSVELCRSCVAKALRTYIRTANLKELQEIISLTSIELQNPFLDYGND